MAKTGRQTHAKRQREFAKREARQLKDERRAARKAAKASGADSAAATVAESMTADENSQNIDNNDVALAVAPLGGN